MTKWATYYDEIADAVAANDDVRSHALRLIPQEPIQAKSLDGGTRTNDFRDILTEIFKGNIDQDAAEERVWATLPPSESPHHGNKQLFHKQWAERLLRSQVGRFYNQSVMELLDEQGETDCYVPKSPRQYQDSKCTQLLAGRQQPLGELLKYLYLQQREEKWEEGVTIPGHANCTHTVVPLWVVDDI